MYACNRCSYKTDNKQNFNNHINRKIPCFLSNGKPKLYNSKEKPKCNICKEKFATKQSLDRHTQSQHTTVYGNNNTINNIINNNNNTNTNNSYNTINIINPTIIVHPFTIYNIFDLTICEQYQTLTSKISPYTSIPDHYNLNLNRPQYHNMHLGNINKNIMDVYNGIEWKKESISTVLDLIIPTQKTLIGSLINRFRIFLNIKALKLIPYAIYYGCAENLKYYKRNALNIKLHLYNNRNDIHVPKVKVPTKHDDEIFWAISKNFICSGYNY